MGENKSTLSPATLAAQGLGWVDKSTRSITPPIYPSTTFERNTDLTYHEGRVYTRADNPTYDQATKLLANLERGEVAHLFASGMSAVVTIFQALRPGDHVVVPMSVYCGVRDWLNRIAGPWGLEYDFTPNRDTIALQKVLKPGKTKLVWIETPSNPDWQITDIAAFSRIAHEVGAIVVADNTVATPVLTRPIELGADIVMHSATKYLNGHGDILMGALIAKKKNDFWVKICSIAHDSGALPGTFEAWLLLRGMRTLYLRMECICSSAKKIAEHFKSHPKVKSIYYPGLKDFPGHEIAKKQMSGRFGGMLSIRFKGGYTQAVSVQAKTKVFKRATSLGTVESLIEHRASYEGPNSPVPKDLLRLSIGIEDTHDLINDLEQAIDAS